MLALPMISGYCDKFPHARISVLAAPSSRAVFEGQHFVHEIIDFNFLNVVKILFRKFDLAVDAMPYFRHSALIAWFSSRYVVGFDTFKQRGKLYHHKIPFDDQIHMVHILNRLFIYGELNSHELIPVVKRNIGNREVLKELSRAKIKIGIHLGTAKTAPWRAWRFDHFRILIHRILRYYPESVIFLSGSESEKAVNMKMLNEIGNPRVIDLAGRCDLHEFAALLEQLDLFVSSDTGPMHVSASMRCPTIGLFGPNTPVRFGPFPLNKNVPLFKPPEGYEPTINVHKGEFGGKEDEAANVINRITPDEVFVEVETILLRNQSRREVIQPSRSSP